MASTKDKIAQLAAVTQKFGLSMEGHIWEEDNKKMPWVQVRDTVAQSDYSLWVIVASGVDLGNNSIRYGLSMLAITVQAVKHAGLPMVFLQADGDAVAPADLPTPFQGIDVLAIDDAGLGAKLVARVHGAPKGKASEFHLDVHGNEQVGQWFEIRPQHDSWPGVIFGVSGAEIAFQAVGTGGKLPEKSMLEYPLQGIKLNLGQKEVTAWSVRNELNPQTSYYVKVNGFPDAIVFGPYAEEEEADLYLINLAS